MENIESKTFLVRSTDKYGKLWVSRLDFDEIENLLVEKGVLYDLLKIYFKGDRINLIPLDEEGKRIMVDIFSWYNYHSKGFCANE